MLRSTSPQKILAAYAGTCLLGLAFLAGCDRLGLGRSREVSVKTAPAPVQIEETSPAGPPPPRVSTPPSGPTKTVAQSPSVPSGVAVAGNQGNAGSGEGDPPARAPGEAEVEPEPPLATDELDKPMEPPPEAKGLIRMPDPEEKGAFQDLWADKVHKRIVLAGRICKRTGEMELFACFRRTKEHESIVSVRARALAIHMTLMALGIQPGRPVQFFPEFRAAEGPEIEVTVAWTDENGKRQTVLAQEWLKNVKTGKAMEQPFIFAGSSIWKDPDGEPHYLAADGDFICVSNFASAMLDLPINSSSANAALLFQAFHERIPPTGTPVALILRAKPREPLEAPPVK